MKHTMKIMIKSATSALLLLCMSSITNASSVDIIGYNNAEIQKTVVGVWSTNNKVNFNNAGTYSILLTDFGLGSAKSPSFGNNFNYLGAMISSSYGNIASATFDKNSKDPNVFLSFDITTPGDYWLSLFAVTDSNMNVGTFNVSLLDGNISPVPLPASFWLMATSLLGLFSFFRQSKAAKT